MLQRFEFTKVCMTENVTRHFSRNFDIFNKNDLPQCLVVFSILLSVFSTIRSLLSELFLYRPPTEHCYDKPIKNLPMGQWSKVHGPS